jgi:hypothetical protein
MSSARMHIVRSAALWLLCATQSTAFAGGVTPYLPVNLEPEIERQIERVLILADKPVMTRPIAAATVLDALPKACKVDARLCEQVRRYLARYTRDTGLTDLTIEASATGGADTTLAERYGLNNRSVWDASLQGYIQPNDFLLVNLGAVAYDGRENPTGSMLSVGFSKAQLDIGYKPHWFSPMSDSSMLMSTEAPTMPSVSLSNYEPLTRLGLEYEFFVARMTHADHIVYGDGFTSGNPRLAGFHLAMEPASGWSFALNRLLQYGGGGRGGSSISNLLHAFVNPSGAQTAGAATSQNAANQEASVTSTLLFPGKVPFAVYAEYAGEDTSHGKNYLLGNSALSVGIHFPRLWQHVDLTLEASEWQNTWYVNSIWQDGMINNGHVVGAWFGDQRVYNDGIGGQSQMVRLGWEPWFGGQLELRYRTLENQTYGPYVYHRFQDLTLGYSRPWKSYTVGAEVEGGRDVFGGSFERLSGFLRLNPDGELAYAAGRDDLDGSDSDAADAAKGEIFIAAGAVEYRVTTDLTLGVPRATTANKTAPHLELGARRALTEHQDLGTRVEFENISGHTLIGVRLLDYRWRFDNPLAIGAYLGAARYALATPAYGFYYGLGVQYRNVLPGWDVGVDVRYDDSIARDHLLATDPPNVGQRNDTFYDVLAAVFTVSRRF